MEKQDGAATGEKERKLPKGIRMRGSKYQGRISYNFKTYCVSASTLTECKKKLLDLQHDLEHNEYIQPTKETLNENFDEWIAGRQKIKIGTVITYKDLYKSYIRNGLGKRSLQSIRREDIEKLRNQMLKDGMAPSTFITLHGGVLFPLFKKAIQSGLIRTNPADIELPENEKKHHVVLTDEQLDSFMKYAKDSKFYNLFRLSIALGLREGEARGLKWSDVDRKAGVVHIRRMIKYVPKQGYIEDTPKSKAGFRDISINQSVSDILKDISADEQVTQIDGYIFHRGKNKVWSYSTIRAEIKLLVSRMQEDGISIPIFTTHSFRREFAVICIKAGMKPLTLSKLMGHTNINLTMSIYADVLGKDRAAEMDMVSGAFSERLDSNWTGETKTG